MGLIGKKIKKQAVKPKPIFKYLKDKSKYQYQIYSKVSL